MEYLGFRFMTLPSVYIIYLGTGIFIEVPSYVNLLVRPYRFYKAILLRKV